jgi:hypothetical protein
MRMLTIFIVTLGMMSPAFAGILNDQGRGTRSPWFQDCEQEVARPFCGTLKIDPAVEAMARQWDKHASLDPRDVEPSPKESPETPDWGRQDGAKSVPQNRGGQGAVE